MNSEDNDSNPLEKLDNMNGLISSSPGRQTSSTPPMPPSTQMRPSVSTNPASSYAHHSVYEATFSSSSMSSQDRSLSGIIDVPFPEFDHKKEVIDPFSEEDIRDQMFHEQLSEMLLDALIETHAWSTARLKYESFSAAEKFEARLAKIIETEKHQGTLTSSYSSPSPSFSPSPVSVFEQTRQRLNEFIGKIRNAIAGLTNTMLL